jgi:hypothetical protein
MKTLAEDWAWLWSKGVDCIHITKDGIQFDFAEFYKWEGSWAVGFTMRWKALPDDIEPITAQQEIVTYSKKLKKQRKEASKQ